MRTVIKISYFILFMCITYISYANEVYEFPSDKQQAQFTHLVGQLRCLVCQNQDIANSNSDFAQDVKNRVYTMVLSGKTDNEIVDSMTSRFGDYILFKPPLKPVTYVLWYGPLIFSLLGLFVFIRILRKNND